MAFNTLQSISAVIKQLEAQKKLVERRDEEVPKALAVLQRHAKILTPAQCRQLKMILRDADGTSSPDGARGPKKSGKGGTVPPKYRLPTGETWTGRGSTPRVFAAWAKGAEGKAWRKAHPGTTYPLAVTRKAMKRLETKPMGKGAKSAGKRA